MSTYTNAQRFNCVLDCHQVLFCRSKLRTVFDTNWKVKTSYYRNVLERTEKILLSGEPFSSPRVRVNNSIYESLLDENIEDVVFITGPSDTEVLRRKLGREPRVRFLLDEYNRFQDSKFQFGLFCDWLLHVVEVAGVLYFHIAVFVYMVSMMVSD